MELNAGNGRLMSLERLPPRRADPIGSFRVTLTVPDGAVTTVVYERWRSLAVYFRELADAWAGFDGVKSFTSLEGQLFVEARHDGRGMCGVRSGYGRPRIRGGTSP